MRLNQIWHCPRPELALSYLTLLQAGPVVSTTIFAPRRTGKTVFLRQDLTPAAQKAGFRVAYADLWQTRIKRPVRKVTAKGGIAGVKGEVEATELALRIEELIGLLVAKQPLLLLVDEAQELARTRENELIAAALRTALTKHRD